MQLIFHKFKSATGCYVFDTSTNSIIQLDEKEYDELDRFEEEPRTSNKVLDRYKNKGFFNAIDIKEIAHNETRYLSSHLLRKQEMVILQVTQKCNLRCSYCPYSESGGYSDRRHANVSMSLETAKKAIDFMFANSADSLTNQVAFYGGEPLLELDFIRACVEYIKGEYPEKSVSYVITTNGTLLTSDTYEFLANEKFNIAVSIDGSELLHDQHRTFPNGDGTYGAIMKNLEEINLRYPESSRNITINTVISPQDDELCNEMVYKVDEVIKYNRVEASFLSDFNIENPYEYTDAFNALYQRELFKLLLYLIGRVPVEATSKILNGMIRTINKEYERLFRLEKFPEVLHPGGTCIPGGSRLFIDVNGNFYPCEKASGNSSAMKIGSLETGFDIRKIEGMLNVGKIASDYCKKCWAVLHCTICAVIADGSTGLDAEKVITRCYRTRYQYQEMLKMICFLKSNGYRFNDSLEGVR